MDNKKRMTEIVASWPDWKRAVTLTKYSINRQAPRQHSACGTKGCKYCDR